MKRSELKSMEHVVKFEDGKYGLIVEWNGILNVQYEDGFDYLTTWNEDFSYHGITYEKHQKNIVSVYEHKISNGYMFMDFGKLRLLWKRDDKVECIIDGQKIMLSRESVEELKKLK